MKRRGHRCTFQKLCFQASVQINRYQSECGQQHLSYDRMCELQVTLKKLCFRIPRESRHHNLHQQQLASMLSNNRMMLSVITSTSQDSVIEISWSEERPSRNAVFKSLRKKPLAQHCITLFKCLQSYHATHDLSVTLKTVFSFSRKNNMLQPQLISAKGSCVRKRASIKNRIYTTGEL